MSEAALPHLPIDAHPPRLARRRAANIAFIILGLSATLIGLATLVALVVDLVTDGGHRLTAEFLLSFPSSRAEGAGVLSAWVGSLLVILTTAAVSIPLGMMAGLYLEEYAPKTLVTSAIEIAVNNLAAVPSIVFGLLALGLFVQTFGLGQSILTGGVTLALLILPVVIVATREAIRAVPNDIRQAALAIGATKWQTTQHHVLPYAMPGVVTGVIIGLSRAIGETAPLILIGGLSFVAFLPIDLPGDTLFRPVGALNEFGAPLDPGAVETVTLANGGAAVLPDGFTRVDIPPGVPVEVPHGSSLEITAGLVDAAPSWSPSHWLGQNFTAMPIQMYNWTSRPEAAFRELAAAAGIMLLVITLLMNGAAIWIRYRLRRALRW